MPQPSPNAKEVAALRSLIDDFINERLQLKLDKLKDDEHEKRQDLLQEHQRTAWLTDAALRVAQIQLASHTLKPIHPDARGTNVYLREPICTDDSIVGTHTLTTDRADDVVGNAAALDVFRFLKLSHDGKTLLKRVLERDAALLAAFSEDGEQSLLWLESFAGIINSKGEAASHTLSRQIYFPVAEDSYHLLAPLFPTALVHRFHQTLQEDRFSDQAKAARAVHKIYKQADQGSAKAKTELEAHRVNEPWPRSYRDYPDLVVQNFGGSKPQNISQLNSERRGTAHLLPSFPPTWESLQVRLPLRQRSAFARNGSFTRRPQVKKLTQDLRKFLVNTLNQNNVGLRNTRARMVDEIVLELRAFYDEILSLPPGWSMAAECRLDDLEKHWLDPFAKTDLVANATTPPIEPLAPSQQPDWRDEIAHRFANWLNATIGTDRTPMGDEEYREWKHVLDPDEMHRAMQRIREDIADGN